MEWGRGVPEACHSLGAMAQEDRPDVLALLRPLPPHPHHQDDDIQSHEEPIEERHRLQPPSGVERVCHAAGRFGKDRRSMVGDTM